MSVHSPALLEAKNLSLEHLWSGISFTLHGGTMLQITGENGAGKTSLLHTLCGLIPPDRGRIFWQQQNIRHTPEEYHSNLIYIGHHDGLKDNLTPLENLSFAAQIHNCPRHTPPQKALATFGITSTAAKLCRHLSAGQRRRTALARLLVHRARLWLLDEPLAALDSNAAHTLGTLAAEHLANGGAIIMATHQNPDWTIPVRHLHLGAPSA